MTTAPSGPSSVRGPWTVAVRWLPWRAPWHRSLAWWARDAIEPARVIHPKYTLDEWHLPGFSFYLFLLVVLLVVGAVIFLVGALLTMVAWVGLVASLAARLVLRQPFLVEATTASGVWHGWWFPGWRRARAARAEIDSALWAGARPEEIRPASALTRA